MLEKKRLKIIIEEKNNGRLKTELHNLNAIKFLAAIFSTFVNLIDDGIIDEEMFEAFVKTIKEERFPKSNYENQINELAKDFIQEMIKRNK